MPCRPTDFSAMLQTQLTSDYLRDNLKVSSWWTCCIQSCSFWESLSLGYSFFQPLCSLAFWYYWLVLWDVQKLQFFPAPWSNLSQRIPSIHLFQNVQKKDIYFTWKQRDRDLPSTVSLSSFNRQSWALLKLASGDGNFDFEGSERITTQQSFSYICHLHKCLKYLFLKLLNFRSYFLCSYIYTE